MRLRRETGDFSIKHPGNGDTVTTIPANLFPEDLVGCVIEDEGGTLDVITYVSPEGVDGEYRVKTVGRSDMTMYYWPVTGDFDFGE